MLDLTKPLVLSDGRKAKVRTSHNNGALLGVSVEGISGTLYFGADGTPGSFASRAIGEGIRLKNADHSENWLCQKIVVGLRQLAAESKGDFTDRLNGYAAELADAIGYTEASADLVAARELAACSIVENYAHTGDAPISIADAAGTILARDDVTGLAAKVRAGRLDACAIVQLTRKGIVKGRELADAEMQIEREQARRQVPDKLTITIDGPPGCGKTTIANWFRMQTPFGIRVPYQRSTRQFDPVIIDTSADPE